MIDIIRHWIPDIRPTKNKNAYIFDQCPFCPLVISKRSFRVNTKLGVWKCYQCGRGAKNIKDFNRIKINSVRSYIYCGSKQFDEPIGCEDYSKLPF